MAGKKSTQKRRHTQAVIVIHGMGEQRPMDTIRGFVDAVLPEPAQGGEKFFSRPDALSESFELRVLQNRSQPRTHFYEYYWAYKVSGTTFSHISSWLSTLLLRSPRRVPKQLCPLWVLSWLLLLAVLASVGLGLFERIPQVTSALLTGAAAFLFGLLQSIVLLFIGDVARYLSPSPGNIKLRQEIRADGIRLLKKLQESGKYDRVIMVGHSLGSVVAYDILKHVWQDCYKEYRKPARSAQPALARVEKAGEDLRMGVAGVTLEDYMSAQQEAWKELRLLGCPWLVTDFITLGSPLTHAALLLASDEPNLRERQRQRELPTNPPEPEIEKTKIGEQRRYSYLVWDGYGPKLDIKLKALHHAALFACTRWTNLYFPALGGFFGDPVSGPMGPWFGRGVRDIPLRSGHPWTDRTVLAHTAYWDKRLTRSLQPLIDALDLKNTKYYE
jgi:hypothetical protein